MVYFVYYDYYDALCAGVSTELSGPLNEMLILLPVIHFIFKVLTIIWINHDLHTLKSSQTTSLRQRKLDSFQTERGFDQILRSINPIVRLTYR